MTPGAAASRAARTAGPSNGASGNRRSSVSEHQTCAALTSPSLSNHGLPLSWVMALSTNAIGFSVSVPAGQERKARAPLASHDDLGQAAWLAGGQRQKGTCVVASEEDGNPSGLNRAELLAKRYPRS